MNVVLTVLMVLVIQAFVNDNTSIWCVEGGGYVLLIFADSLYFPDKSTEVLLQNKTSTIITNKK